MTAIDYNDYGWRSTATTAVPDWVTPFYGTSVTATSGRDIRDRVYYSSSRGRRSNIFQFIDSDGVLHYYDTNITATEHEPDKITDEKEYICDDSQLRDLVGYDGGDQ